MKSLKIGTPGYTVQNARSVSNKYTADILYKSKESRYVYAGTSRYNNIVIIINDREYGKWDHMIKSNSPRMTLYNEGEKSFTFISLNLDSNKKKDPSVKKFFPKMETIPYQIDYNQMTLEYVAADNGFINDIIAGKTRHAISLYNLAKSGYFIGSINKTHGVVEISDKSRVENNLRDIMYGLYDLNRDVELLPCCFYHIRLENRYASISFYSGYGSPAAYIQYSDIDNGLKEIIGYIFEINHA